MSEHISIQEGGQSRNFGPVNLLETETTDGTGSCFWVPESARELESDYFIENGDYTPEKYAYSDVTVRVMEPFDDLEIGFLPDPEIPDIPIPHIEEIPDPITPVPPIDLTIDPDTGLPKVKIDGVDIDLPDISADIDINGDLDISLDLENNELDISGLNMDGLDVNLSIDLGTLDIDVTDLPDEIRIMHVPTKTAYKDGEEIDLDGIIVQAYRGGEVWNDASGKYIDGYVPAHELVVNPNKVQMSGGVDGVKGWKKTTQWGTRPAIPIVKEFSHICKRGSQDHKEDTPETIETLAVTAVGEAIIGILPRAVKVFNAQTSYPEYLEPIKSAKAISFFYRYIVVGTHREVSDTKCVLDIQTESSHVIKSGTFKDFPATSTSTGIEIRGLGGGYSYAGPQIFYSWTSHDAWLPDVCKVLGADDRRYHVGTRFLSERNIVNLTPDIFNANGVINANPFPDYGSFDYVSEIADCILNGNYVNTITISWPRPKDNKLLTTSFDISVEESEGGAGSGGTHHSGKF